MIHSESCIDTLKRDVKYDYVLTSPPDYAEIGVKPNTDEWENFLHSWVSLLNPTSNLVSICTTDRKADGRIYPKHIKVINVFEKNNWFLRKTNVWVKTLKRSDYRMGYMHLLTFARKPFKLNNPHMPEDAILDEKSTVVYGFKFGMSISVVKKMIENCTKENDIVYDPFMGSGTTAIAALQSRRNYLGSEINEEYYNLCKKRIESDLTLR